MRLTDFLKVLAILVFVISSFSSCKKDDLLTDSSARLDFSEDTIIFDTVFTTIGSTTQYLLVYNKNDQPVKISSIQLAKGNASYYRMNVNGIAANYVSDVEIRAKDSLWIFIEVTIDPGNQNTPFLVMDSILFNLNGNIQDVDLVAYGQDAHFITPTNNIGGLAYSLIDTTTCATITWDSIKPYVIYGYAVVDECQTLIIQPGTKIYFYNNGGLWVFKGGNLDVNGELEHPVVFQGTRLEQSYSETPGQWDRIWINEGGTNSIDYAIIKNGFIGLQTDYFDDDFNVATNCTINNTIIKNMSGVGMYCENFNIDASNLVVANCGTSCAALYAGSYNFKHCTFANYWRYGQRSGPAIFFANYFDKYNSAGQNIRNISSLNATISNSIAYGNADSEIDFDWESGADSLYKFKNCVIKADPARFNLANLSRFENVINNQEPQFENTTDNIYKLEDISPAKNFGDVTIGGQVPLDILGNNRTASPDCGAYERQ
ncbi:MAG TPA: hypothetical protein PKN75_04305 [Bacteroidia bacterium]|nr:hypothetical protein [Bacteroidia bacterium]HNU32793.1 hypothetical protein [Bacteroidia bacterium]